MKKVYWVSIILIGFLAGLFSSTTPIIPLIFENIPLFLQGFIFLYLIYFTIKGGYPQAYQEDIKKHGKKKTLQSLRQVWITAIFLPGSTHYLTGKTAKGIVFFLVIESLLLLAFIKLSLPLILLAAAAQLYNIIDAYHTAKKAKL